MIARTIDSILDINQIDIADGLKDLLIELGYYLETLLDTTPEKTAEILCIDLYVAKKTNTYCCDETISVENNRLVFSSYL